MNLGNQNSKYSWRIRDLENPQTKATNTYCFGSLNS